MNNRFEALKVFCSLAETLQFKETANRLAVSPPVITRVIAELEAHLGEPLFNRSTRQVQLTDFGEQFLPQAQSLLLQSEQLFAPAKQQEEEMVGLVRITVPSWRMNDEILAELLSALAPYPDLVIDWRDDMTKLDTVSHRIDIGLRIGVKPDDNFIVRKISAMGDILAVSPKLLARLGTPKSLDELETRFPFAAQINHATGRAWHFPLNGQQQLRPRHINFLSGDIYSGLQAVLSGRCVGLLGDKLCEPYLADGELVRLFPEIDIEKWQLFLYRPYETITPPRVLKVFDLLTEILQRKFNE